MSTLFERYGGFATVRKIVSTFYERVLDDAQLQHFFVNIDMPRLIDHQTKFISTIMGGPASISNDLLRRAHAPLGVSAADFRRVAAILEEALEDNGLAPEDIAYVMAEVSAREAHVVTRS